MLPKKQRLNKQECSTLIKEGLFFNNSFFVVRYVVANISKYAVVVPKKIYPKAHDRNKLRRSIYHLIYNNIQTKDTGAYVMMVAKPTIRSMKPEGLEEVVKKIIQHTILNQ